MEALGPLGYQALPTAEQGGCGIGVIASWVGKELTDTAWKALRMELPSALEACAKDSALRGIPEVRGEGAAKLASRREPRADARQCVTVAAQLVLEHFTTAREKREACARMEAAAQYFCGLTSARAEVLA